MTFDAAQYRQVLGHFPTGVTVVTGRDGGRMTDLAHTADEPDPLLFFRGKLGAFHLAD